MQTLCPVHTFLRVNDKYQPEFVNFDPALPSVPSYLYVQLFQLCGKAKRDRCTVPQTHLAKICKCSVRSIQAHLRRLIRLEYIQIERHEDTGLNSYILLLSSRVRQLMTEAGIDLVERPGTKHNAPASAVAPAPSRALKASPHTPPACASLAQNPREGGAKSAPSLKRYKRDHKSPLSPHLSADGQGVSTPPIRSSVISALSGATPQADGWGDFSCGKNGKKPFQAVNAAFERLYAEYPRKEAKEAARSAWHQLWRRGSLPAPDRLLAALDTFRASPHWSREHGRFVPYLVNWLRGCRWLDEPPAAPDMASASPGISPGCGDEIRNRLDRLHERLKGQPNPALESVRPAFEAFLARFSDGQEMRAPAWGLWSLLHSKGNAPTAAHTPGRDAMGVLAFLRQWQWGGHVAA